MLLSFLTVSLKEVGVKDVKALAAVVKNNNRKLYELQEIMPSFHQTIRNKAVQYLLIKIIEEKLRLTTDTEDLFKKIFE